MTFLALLERCLWGLSTLLQAALLARLLRLGLHRTYRAFAAMLALETLRFLAALPLRAGTTAYAWLFLLSEPVLWLVQTLVVLELYGHMLRDHAGLRRAGRGALVFLLLLCLASSAMTAMLGADASAERYPVLFYYGVVSRIVCFSLVLFLLLATGLLVWFPIELGRNALALCAGLSALFVGRTAVLLLPTLTGRRVPPEASAAMLALSCICLAFWLWGLTPEGERKRVVPGHSWSPEDRERLVRQLATVNEGLLRLSRR